MRSIAVGVHACRDHGNCHNTRSLLALSPGVDFRGMRCGERGLSLARLLRVRVGALPRRRQSVNSSKPAIKLLNFYGGLALGGGGLPPLATEEGQETERISAVLRAVGAIDARLLQGWIHKW
jgi:hypothetical protein